MVGALFLILGALFLILQSCFLNSYNKWPAKYWNGDWLYIHFDYITVQSICGLQTTSGSGNGEGLLENEVWEVKVG